MLHFILIGAGLFAFYTLTTKTTNENNTDAIVITHARVDELATGFARTWQRPPASEDIDNLIQSAVREEVYYREALAMGLDKDDSVIRRRLQQKLEFITSDLLDDSKATDTQLTEYLQAHPDNFRTEMLFSFSQVYFNPDKHPDTLDSDVEKLLKQLSSTVQKVDPSSLGDITMLEHSFSAVSASELARILGEDFVSQIKTLTPGSWQGPIQSSYGIHLVLINERVDAHLPELADIREAVLREYTNAKRVTANEQFYQDLLKKYKVTIEK